MKIWNLQYLLFISVTIIFKFSRTGQSLSDFSEFKVKVMHHFDKLISTVDFVEIWDLTVTEHVFMGHA